MRLPGLAARNLPAPEAALEKRPFLRVAIQRRARTLGRDLSPQRSALRMQCRCRRRFLHCGRFGKASLPKNHTSTPSKNPGRDLSPQRSALRMQCRCRRRFLHCGRFGKASLPQRHHHACHHAAIGRRKPSGGIPDVLIDSSKNHGLESRPREVRTRGAASDRPAQPKTTSSPSPQ